ncbi:MAG: type II methionyl aminopeptidase [Planctomycetes bacterium]|nr:type II methionyl aminopeptidase [Planctomycetota bacterium]MCC7064752.1 type II methionyl aminopeptidase [Planctomycetota bacterium]
MKIDLDKLRQSGRISATALAHGRKLIVPGAKLEDIQNEVERVIREMGGSPAFPAQSSRNHIAAHYCSPPGDATTVQAGDIVKLDCGTHVDGYVTDNATTVDLRDGENSLLCAASRMALENAIAVMGPGASLTEVGRQIETTIGSLGFKPVRNLTGHGVARYTIHCAPSVPNYADSKAPRLRANMTIACEPFASDGKGMIDVDGKAEVFMLRRDVRPKDNLPADLAKAMEQTEGLPFARRDLVRWLGSLQKCEDALKVLYKKDLVDDYPPLCERPGVRIAQFEHTIFIHENGAEVLTRLPD